MVEIGQRYRTPFDPSGVVEVLELTKPTRLFPAVTALVRYIGDHPHGYPDGSLGRYFADQLRPLFPEDLEDAR